MTHPPTVVRRSRVLRHLLICAAFLAALLLTRPLFAVAEDFEAFTGSGFSPTPTAGQLDSDSWSIEGLSDGDILFGDTATSGDGARGASVGGVGSGGVYAFDTGGNVVLGFQSTGTDLTPGAAVYRVRNDSGNTVTAVDITYELWVRNDQSRATAVSMSYAADCTTYTAVAALAAVTPETAAPTPAWAPTTLSDTVSSLSIAPGAAFCLRWDLDDGGGSGSRDEIGLDNVLVTPASPTLVTLADFSAVYAENAITLTWQSTVELDNAGFNLLRAEEAAGPYLQLNDLLLASQAEPGHGAGYVYHDRTVAEADVPALYYMLEDVDLAGATERHGPIRVTLEQGNGTHTIYLPGIMQ